MTGSSDTVTVGAGSTARIAGTGDTVTAGLNDLLTDAGASTLFRIGATVGTLTIAGLAADPTGVLDLLGGAGGYATAAAASGALTNDGAGGGLLSLGAAGSIHFAGAAPGAGAFRIG